MLVYSLGKVGTTALLRVLESELDAPVVHCHRVATQPGPAWHSDPAARTPRSRAAWRGDYIRKRLERDRSSRWDVVCGVRDPVGRAVSAMFQVGGRSGLFDDAASAGEFDRLVEALDQRFANGEAGLDWFDVELGQVTGVDVFATPFPHDTGYATYEAGRFRVLLIRYEDLRRVGAAAISEFFSIDVREIPRANVAAGKGYRGLYDEFLRSAVLPDHLLDAAYGSALARHFYTEGELEQFRARWSPR